MPFPTLLRATRLALMLVAVAVAVAVPLRAQDVVAAPRAAGASADSLPRATRPARYWRHFAAGFAASLLAHETAHVVTALAVGAQPSFGFDKGRPTVYSGIDSYAHPRQQFLFSSMGLNVQAALDEGILDVPHRRGAPFERGVLAGGIATALFYVTIGRTASVSDVDFMARTSSLSKTDLTLIYGGVALLHAVRIHHDHRYANFFVRPAPAAEGGLRLGVDVR